MRTALGCRCRGADCSSRRSIVPTTASTRGAGATEPDNNIVHALIGGRGPAAAGQHRGCGSENRVRALPRCRAGVPHPADVAGSRGHGAAAVVRSERGLTDRRDGCRHLVALVGLYSRRVTHGYALYAMLAVGSEAPRATQARMCAALVGRVRACRPPQRGRRKGPWRAGARQDASFKSHLSAGRRGGR